MTKNRLRGAISAAFTKRFSIKRKAKASEAYMNALDPRPGQLTRQRRISAAAVHYAAGSSQKGSKAFLAAEARGDRIRKQSTERGREELAKERVAKRITLPKVRGYWGDE